MNGSWAKDLTIEFLLAKQTFSHQTDDIHGIPKQHKRIKKSKKRTLMKSVSVLVFPAPLLCNVRASESRKREWMRPFLLPLLSYAGAKDRHQGHHIQKKYSHVLLGPRFGVDRRGKRGSSERKYCLSVRKVLFKSVSKVLLFLLLIFSAHLLYSLQLCVSPLNKGCKRAYYYCGLSTRFF